MNSSIRYANLKREMVLYQMVSKNYLMQALKTYTKRCQLKNHLRYSHITIIVIMNLDLNLDMQELET